MDQFSLAQAAFLVFAGFAVAMAALICLTVINRAQSRRTASPQPEIAFLFDGEELIDATQVGRALLDAASARGSDMTRLVTFLAARFPDLRDRVAACGEQDRIDLTSADGTSCLKIETRGARLRIGLSDKGPVAPDLPERHFVGALMDELATYRRVGDEGPVPVWRQAADGTVNWANGAYLDLAEQAQTGTETPSWPPAALFPELACAAPRPGTVQCLRLDLPGGDAVRWFDVQTAGSGNDRLFTAIPADRAVKAERRLRDFVEALTQTFAHLDVGLAIFDRQRQLRVFNPALVDLMGFAPEYLVGHPTLGHVLDELRDRQMIPEPKDYRSWRQHLSELEAAALDGTYCETWPLPDGRTLRVTGRPHPDGAVAFLFENISAEVSQTRRLRADLAVGQAVIDTMADAVAVFSADGVLALSNRAYADMWGPREDDPAQPMTFLDASRIWQRVCAPTPVWGDARDFAAQGRERADWTADVRLCDGRRLSCRFEALSGGNTLVAFSRIRGVSAPETGGLRPAAMPAP